MPSDNIGIALLSLLIVLALPAFADTPAGDRLGGACDYTPVQLYREVSPSVVSISGMAINPFDPRERVSWAVGSGIIVDSDGHHFLIAFRTNHNGVNDMRNPVG